MNPERHFRKFSLQGYLPPKFEIESRLQATGCTAARYCLLHVPTRARKFPRSVNFSVQRTVAQLRGVKIAQFLDFGLFPHKKPLKRTSGHHPIQARGYIAEWLRFLPRDAMHKRGLCGHAVSACLSVTFVNSVKTNKHIIKHFSPSGSHTILVLGTP